MRTTALSVPATDLDLTAGGGGAKTRFFASFLCSKTVYSLPVERVFSFIERSQQTLSAHTSVTDYKINKGHSTRFFPKIARVGNDFFTILIFTYV